jgi:hypothetical protein
VASLPDPLPTTDVARFVADLAREHGVVVVRTRLDAFAEKATELSGDEVRLDETEIMLTRLAEQGVITGRHMGLLMLNHIRERKRLSGLS